MRRSLPSLRLNFRESPAKKRRFHFVALVLALAVVAAPVLHHRQIMRETVRMEQQVAALSDSLTHPVAVIRVPDDVGNKLLGHLNAPWETLLDGLENAASGKATLLSMQPNLMRGEAVLSGEAARYADVLDYIERLKAQPGFAQVYLTNHAIAEDTPGKPVRFSIALQWGAPR